MIRNKVEVEIILTDNGSIKLKSNGALYSIEKHSPLATGLEIDLYYSLGMDLSKMKLKEGDAIISNGIKGKIIKANPFDEYVTILTEDDNKEYEIRRKFLEKRICE